MTKVVTIRDLLKGVLAKIQKYTKNTNQDFSRLICSLESIGVSCTVRLALRSEKHSVTSGLVNMSTS